MNKPRCASIEAFFTLNISGSFCVAIDGRFDVVCSFLLFSFHERKKPEHFVGYTGMK